MFQTEVVDKAKTFISCSITFCKYRAIYEIRRKNIVELGGTHDNIVHAHSTLDT